MGAESSMPRADKSQEDASAPASAGELSADPLQEGNSVLESKSLQKNGQVSSMTSLNGHSEDSTLAEVGQPDGVSVAQKEEATENMDSIQDEVAPEVTVEKEPHDANDISAVEEKAAEETPDDANEVGFKKIFRFVGFKFTLKKDKRDEKDPVKLLTVKDKDGEVDSKADEPSKEAEAPALEDKSRAEELDADKKTPTAETVVTEDGVITEPADAPAEDTPTETTNDEIKTEDAEKEVETTVPSQETTLSPLRKLFNGVLFSNLRKKASIKKTKEEEEKETAVEEEKAKTEETTAAVEEKDEKVEVEQAPATAVGEKTESQEDAATPEEVKSEPTPEPELTADIPVPAATTSDDSKQEEESAESIAEEEKAPVQVVSEHELVSSQEKAKPLGSPLKKLFTGAGLKKLSTKKQKTKKDAEAKLTESDEHAGEQLQSSTESAEAPKSDSGPSSPEESGEHTLAVENDSAQETDGEVPSDGEKKKEGIIAWSSFKKLVTPKKRVKRSSESEDEATGEKRAKSATLSSSESAALADKSDEEEPKEDKPSEEEPKTESAEKLVSSTEEPKKKMDTSVSWEALMCMGGPKKRTRRTSDSDDEETKVDEELQATSEGEQEAKTEIVNVSSENAECEAEVSLPELLTSPPERESAWDTLKRMVMPKTKAKVEEKPEESSEQVQSDSEAPKDESSFSLKKFLPGRRKKKAEKQASNEQGSGEEDSDTPAVVPLSEYTEQAEVEQEVSAEPSAVQTHAPSDDRAPSWIPAVVLDAEEKHEELSDIPEEGENAVTPKSVDTDLGEDEIINEHSKDKGCGRSTAEVMPVSTAPSAETTPVPQAPKPESAEKVIGVLEVQVNEIPITTSVIVEDVPVEVASENTEDRPPAEEAESKTQTILESHTSTEVMSVCTGLDSEEIAEVPVETPVIPSTECVALICEALSTEVSVEEPAPCLEEPFVTEDAVHDATVQPSETPLLAAINSPSQTINIEVTESHEIDIEKAEVVEESVLQLASITDNVPEAVQIIPVSPTTETAVCDISTEFAVPQIKEQEILMEQHVGTDENVTVEEVQCGIAEEVTAENALSEVPQTEGVPVIAETTVLLAPVSLESDQEATSEVITASKPVGDEQAEVEDAVESVPAPETVEDRQVQAGDLEVSAFVEQANEEVDETKEEVEQVSEIEAQSIVIAQAVIQDAMDAVSEDATEPKRPSSPTAAAPVPVQAVSTTEKEIELADEPPVITEAPVVITSEKTPKPLCVAVEVIDTIPVEVVENLDAVEEEEKKPEEELKQEVEEELKQAGEEELKQAVEEGLKQAVEVEVSEEIVIVEEVVEIKAESEAEKELEEIKEDQSQEVTEVQEADEKPQLEEEEVGAEEDTETVLEVQTPVPVILQTAEVIEEPSVDEEAVVELEASIEAVSNASENKDSALSEECQTTTLVEVSTPTEAPVEPAGQPETEKPSSVKCAEVMAQVIEVIEEAVKEIEPLSTEITTAS